MEEMNLKLYIQEIDSKVSLVKALTTQTLGIINIKVSF
jgi:hypothetical protein